MFGAKPTGFSFGGNTSTFGASTPFGAGNTSTFGKSTGNTTFGQPTAFGSQTPAATGSSGMFGQNTTQNAGGLFGQQQNTTFGASQSSGFSFGATPAASSAGGGLFGQQNTTQTAGLFATPTANTGFGAKPTSFGSFGANTGTSSGLFGNTSTQQNTSLFGQTNTAAGFGTSAPSSGTPLKFNPPSSQDTMVKNGVTQNISTRHQCITAMKEYQSKSLEELRVEDYLANRKGKQTTTGFASPAPGNTGAFSFNQKVNNGFAAASPFQATPASSATSLFGTQSQANTMFGQKNGFGSTATSVTPGFGTFGTQPNPAGTTFFGNTQQKTPLFGTPVASTQPSLFGQTSTFSTGFNASTQGFGAPASSSNGLFARPAFGTTATTASTAFVNPQNNFFSKPAANPGLFGATSQAPAFGTSTGAPGVFGKQTGFAVASSAPSFNFASGPTGFNLSKPGGFGLNTTNTFTGFSTGITSTANPLGAQTQLSTATNTSASVPSQFQIQQQLLALSSSPYGDSPLFWNLKQSDSKREDVLKPTNPAAQKAVLSNQFKVSPRPTARIKPKSLHNVLNGSKSQMFEGLEDEDFSFGNESFMPKKSIKKLVIRKNGSESFSPSRASSVVEESNQSPNEVTQNGIHLHSIERPDRENRIENEPQKRIENDNLDDTIEQLNVRSRIPITSRSPNDTDYSLDRTLPENLDTRPTTPPPPNAAGIVLTRPGYYTIPSIEDLCKKIDDNGDCWVDGFTVGREGYGSIFFHGQVNVAGLDLDEIVHIRRKEVIVYPDDDNKPAEGNELNRKAEITLDSVWPHDKSTREYIKDPERLKTIGYNEKLEEITARIGGRFLDYRPETGSWVFEVKHFTKYGMDESDEEDLSALAQKQLKGQKLAAQMKKVSSTSNGVGPPPFPLNLPESVQPPQDVIVPMTEDDNEGLPDITQETLPDHALEDSGDDELGTEYEDKPSSHRLAQSMEVSARNMQVMKASFFGDDNDQSTEPAFLRSGRGTSSDKKGPSLFSSAYKSSFMSPVKLSSVPQNGDYESSFPPRLLTPEPIRAVKQKFHQPPVAEHLSLPSGMRPEDLPRKIVGSRIQRCIPDYKKSTMHGNQKMMVDAALFHGRSFRVGWGPGWTLVHSGTSLAEPVSGKDPGEKMSLMSSSNVKRTDFSTTKWTVTMETIGVADYFSPEDKTLLRNHEELLAIQLDHSQMEEEDGCPLFVPDQGIDSLQQYVEQTARDRAETENHPDHSSMSHVEIVWNLCAALWGRLPGIINSDYEETFMRREAVSNWLSSCALDVIQKEIQEAKYKGISHLPALFAHLTGKQIAEACRLAQNSKDHRLAFLLAQAVGSHYPRQLLEQQMDEWAELEATGFVEEVRLKVYALLAGRLVWQAPGVVINTCENLDWKRALALHMWYRCPPSAPIPYVLQEYEQGFQGSSEDLPEEIYCCVPLPPYLENCRHVRPEDDDMNVSNVRDTCYHLLKLYCEKSYPLEKVLSPDTSTDHHLDYRLSWHMQEILQSLPDHYTHLSAYHKTFVHMGFASQLESIGLWQWAVFAVLHIEDRQCREAAVKDLLNRYICLSKDENYKAKEAFLIEKLHVPEQWIHYAKALRAKCESRPHDEAHHLLKSGHWNEGHQVILRYIASRAIINLEHDYLRKYLVELSPPERCTRVLNWHIGGQVFLDYINMCRKIEELKESIENQEVHGAQRLENFQPDIMSLSTRISGLHCRNSTDRLCQSEMATVLFQTILSLQKYSTDTDFSTTRLLASYISTMAMPENSRLRGLRALMRQYTLESMS